MLSRFIALNIISRFWTALSSLFFLPLYVDLLGLDSFAIVALGSTIAGVIAIFDLGMSNATLRELARRDISAEQRHAAFITLRTIYCSSVIGIILVAPFASAWIVNNFVSNSPLPAKLLQICLTLVIIEAALQIFFRFLVSAMMGAERQIAANLFNLGWSIARNALVLGPIYLRPDLQLFFCWQLAVTALCALAAWVYVHRMLFAGVSSLHKLFNVQAFARIRTFAGGLFLVSVVAAVNTQLDKLAIGRALDIINLGYYSLAVTLGTGILVLPSALVASIQPRLTGHYSRNETKEAQAIFLQVAGFAAIVIFPLAAVIAANSKAVIMVWTGEASIAAVTAPVMPIIAVSYAMLAIQIVPYGVALANGHTRYNNVLGALTLLLSVPGYWFTVERFGISGAAWTFFALQSIASISFIILIDRRFVHFGITRTLLRLLIVPALISASTAWVLAQLISSTFDTRLGTFIYLALCSIVTSGLCLLVGWLMFGLRLKIN